MLQNVVAFLGGLAVAVGVLAAMTWTQAISPTLEPTKDWGEAADGFRQRDLSPQLVGISPADSLARSAVGDQPPLPAAFILEEVTPAVVRISTKTVAGSGVIIDPAGILLTSAHIVSDNEVVRVMVEKKEPLVGTVFRVDEARDLALVRLPPDIYHWAELDTRGELSLGAPVYALGYPLNMAGPATVTAGVVSRYFDEPSSGRRIIQTDAAINLGNSGGPILNKEGRVIGITTSILGDYPSRPTTGISFAVSIGTITDHFLD